MAVANVQVTAIIASDTARRFVSGIAGAGVGVGVGEGEGAWFTVNVVTWLVEGMYQMVRLAKYCPE